MDHSRIVGTALARQKNRSRKMGEGEIIIEYVRSCAAGALRMSDCGPVWQLGVIAAFLVAAVVALVVLRLRAAALAR
jgi:hypothetical protein